MMENIEQERTIHLTEYYHVLLKHKWLILSSLILVSAFTAFTIYRMVPVYRATCVMVIENEKLISPLTGQRTEYENYYTQSLRFSTHAQLITSRPVIQRVIKKLKTDQPQDEITLEISSVNAFMASLKEYIAGLKQNIQQNPVRFLH